MSILYYGQVYDFIFTICLFEVIVALEFEEKSGGRISNDVNQLSYILLPGRGNPDSPVSWLRAICEDRQIDCPCHAS